MLNLKFPKQLALLCTCFALLTGCQPESEKNEPKEESGVTLAEASDAFLSTLDMSVRRSVNATDMALSEMFTLTYVIERFLHQLMSNGGYDFAQELSDLDVEFINTSDHLISYDAYLDLASIQGIDSQYSVSLRQDSFCDAGDGDCAQFVNDILLTLSPQNESKGTAKVSYQNSALINFSYDQQNGTLEGELDLDNLQTFYQKLAEVDASETELTATGVVKFVTKVEGEKTTLGWKVVEPVNLVFGDRSLSLENIANEVEIEVDDEEKTFAIYTRLVNAEFERATDLTNGNDATVRYSVDDFELDLTADDYTGWVEFNKVATGPSGFQIDLDFDTTNLLTTTIADMSAKMKLRRGSYIPLTNSVTLLSAVDIDTRRDTAPAESIEFANSAYEFRADAQANSEFTIESNGNYAVHHSVTVNSGTLSIFEDIAGVQTDDTYGTGAEFSFEAY